MSKLTLRGSYLVGEDVIVHRPRQRVVDLVAVILVVCVVTSLDVTRGLNNHLRNKVGEGEGGERESWAWAVRRASPSFNFAKSLTHLNTSVCSKDCSEHIVVVLQPP